MAEHQWYYVSSGLTGDEQIGPVSEVEFLSLVKSGNIKPGNMVSSQTRTKGNWYEAQNVPGIKKLFDQMKIKQADDRRAKKDVKLQKKLAANQERIEKQLTAKPGGPEMTPQTGSNHQLPLAPAKSKREVKTIIAIVVIVFLITIIFSIFYPLFALLAAVALLTLGIAYVAWPALSERIAILRNRPFPPVSKRIFSAGPAILLGILLLVLSQATIRGSWRADKVRAEVATEIDQANSALDEDRVEDALKICGLLDSKADGDQKKQIASIRSRAEQIENERFAQKLILNGQEHLSKNEFDEARRNLEKVLKMSFGSKSESATKFANAIVAARMRSARVLFNAGDLTEAKEIAKQATIVPGATLTTDARQFIVVVCNSQVQVLVAAARESLDKNNREEAASSLERALAIEGATEIADAEKLYGPIREARQAKANERVVALLADAKKANDSKLYDEAIRILNSAAAVPHSTKNQDVNGMLRLVKKQRDAEANRMNALAEKERRRIAAAKKAIESQFSSWDGSHKNLTKYIKKQMNDPKSYDHAETVYRKANDYLIVTTTFRGTNAFGGVVKNSVTAKVDMKGNLIEIISQDP